MALNIDRREEGAGYGPTGDTAGKETSPLFEAFSQDNKGEIFTLIDGGTPVDARGVDDRTLLHQAGVPPYIDGVISFVGGLLKRNADVNSAMKDGVSPLHAALLPPSSQESHASFTDAERKTQLELVELLVNNNADLDKATDCCSRNQNGQLQVKGGQTPLHLAVMHGTVDLVDFLLKNNANVDTFDALNATPLFRAIDTLDPEKVRSLLRGGASVKIEGMFGIKPLKYHQFRLSYTNHFMPPKEPRAFEAIKELLESAEMESAKRPSLRSTLASVSLVAIPILATAWALYERSQRCSIAADAQQSQGGFLTGMFGSSGPDASTASWEECFYKV